MRRRLMIPCPQCTNSETDFFRFNTCSYCNGKKEVDILHHFRMLDITDDRLENVKDFIKDPRFIEYLETKS